MWDIEKLACQTVLEGHTDWIWNVYYDADSETIISASDDTTVAVSLYVFLLICRFGTHETKRAGQF